MPAKLDRCVARVKADIKAGKLPKGSNAWAICNAAMSRKKEKRNPHPKKSGVAEYVKGCR